MTMNRFGHVFLYGCLLSLSVVHGQVDRTIEDGATGPEVVEAVVDLIRGRCIFAEDKLFLRRLAYVESEDGSQPDTFRPGYYGGIWQMDEAMFNSISCAGVMQVHCDNVQAVFSIAWATVQWQDLLKPLYSGLAASLYAIQQNIQSIQGTLSSQAEFWETAYHPGEQADTFLTLANSIGFGCLSKKKDVVFVLDSSGSIQAENFEKILEFVENVVDKMDVSFETTRVGIVRFSFTARVMFSLNTYSNKADLIDRIRSIAYDIGSTNTAEAIDMAHAQVFNEANGARSGVPRVIILVTDGASNDMDATVLAATIAKDDAIEIFAIGIGDIKEDELTASASSPSCTHFYHLGTFSEVDSIIYDIEKKTCDAPQVVDPVGNEVEIIDNPDDGSDPSIIKVPTDGNTGVAIGGTATCTEVTIYVSYNTQTPNSAFYDYILTVSEGNPAYLYIPNTGWTDLYIATDNENVNGEDCLNPSYSMSINREDDPCNTPFECLSFALDDEYVVYCNEIRQLVVLKCIGITSIDECPSKCVPVEETTTPTTTPTTPTTTPTTPTTTPTTTPSTTESPVVDPAEDVIANPCTSTSFQFYWPHPNDVTKFIQCSQWGTMYVMSCAPGTVWSPTILTCVYAFQG